MDDSKKPTIRDIAKALDLAISTVSISLKDSPRVSKETRDRVKRVAHEMGYAPDPRLASVMSYMKKKRSDKPVAGLAYVVSIPRDVQLEHHPIFHNYYLGAKQRASELGYRLENFNLKLEGLSGERLMSILRGRGIEGVVISPFFGNRERLDIDYSAVSSITFGYSLENDGINRVTIDQYLGVLRSFEEIAKFGYKRIGFVTSKNSNSRMQHRWGAAHAAFHAMNPKQERVPQLEGATRDDFLKWFSQYKPDALLCQGMAWPVYLHGEGLICPRDYGFATLEQDSVEMHCALLGKPEITRQLVNAAGLNQGSLYVGGLAVELLAKDLALNLKGLSDRPKMTLVEGHWIDGATLRAQ